MLLDRVTDEVSNQLRQQSDLGVQITPKNDVPDKGPTDKGLWYQIPCVTAVFADLKDSTALSSNDTPRVAAVAYTYFIRAMAVILERFDAKYVDIHGDGIFGLFSGKGSTFHATACAITMRTQAQQVVAHQFKKDLGRLATYCWNWRGPGHPARSAPRVEGARYERGMGW